jgi:two-component system cell cycle sensor histidine kinase/response regulator CckA
MATHTVAPLEPLGPSVARRGLTAPPPARPGSLWPPLPEPDASWLARSVKLVGWATVAGLALPLLRGILFDAVPNVSSSVVLGAGVLLVGVALWLNHVGQSRRAAQTLAYTLPILAGGLALSTGRGFRDPAILMMPATLILCGLLLDRATLAATTAVTVAATTGLLLAERHGIVAGPARFPYGDILDSLVILVITSVAVGIVAGRLRRGMETLRRQETALRESELRYRALVDLAADAIVLGSPTEGLLEANRRAFELSGYSHSEIRGRRFESFFSPAELARVPFDYEAVARGETVVAERVLTRKDGSQVPVEMSTKLMPDGNLQSIIRDVSERYRAEGERRSLEERLRQAQKMEAVGRLAGGVAHDFNNLLTAITGSLTMALRNLPESSPARRWLTEVDRSAWRAAALTRRLLAFSRQQVIEPKVLDLRSVVEGMGSLVGRTIGEDVRLRVRLADEPCRVEVDHGQMEQIILNLATNARDAMPDGGVLTLEVGWASSASLPVAAWAELGERRVAVVSVSDTGQGMTDEVQARIFEPFFTTKPSGSGTGLGLAMVYGAAQQNGGWIEVNSSPGRGSIFRLFLPEARTEADSRSESATEEALRGTETVLLVEDEPAVRGIVAEQLESLGYRVLSCAGAQEALSRAAGHEGPLHLLLTDVVMPDLDGRELARRLLETRKKLRVLYTSGYGEEVISRHGILDEGVLLLQKPFSRCTLARQVRRALAPSEADS